MANKDREITRERVYQRLLEDRGVASFAAWPHVAAAPSRS